MGMNLRLKRCVVDSLNNITAGDDINVTCDAKTVFQESITNGSTNVEYILAIDYSQIQLISIHANYAMTVKTNSSGSPTDTVTLVAGKAQIYKASDGSGCPITADVTKIYVTNSSGSNGILTIIVGYDTTP
jgi:hypothetical protein